MNRTSTFVTDAIGQPEPVTPGTNCRRVIIGEENQAGTADFYVYGAEKDAAGNVTGPSAVGALRPAGTRYTFEAIRDQLFPAGVPVAYVAAATGSLTMTQEEE